MKVKLINKYNGSNAENPIKSRLFIRTIMNKRIQDVSSCPLGMICVIANTCYNENEMYLADENIIRREHTSELDPEFILLFNESSELYGLFKKTHTEVDSSSAIWEKVYC